MQANDHCSFSFSYDGVLIVGDGMLEGGQELFCGIFKNLKDECKYWLFSMQRGMAAFLCGCMKNKKNKII